MRRYRQALITGASRGIGLAFAQELPPDTDLLLTGRDAERLDDEAAKLARPGRSVATIVADLANDADRDRLVDAAEAARIDLLINNAGSAGFGGFLETPADGQRQTVLVNVLAVVDLTRRLLPGMLDRARQDRRRAGLIIVSSTAAFAPLPFLATYAASKAFELSLTEALAEELRSEPVDVLALCPGATRTGFGASAGYTGASLPGASSPRDVAAKGLAALGQDTLCITGRLSPAAPAVVLPRRIVSGAMGAAMRFLAKRS